MNSTSNLPVHSIRLIMSDYIALMKPRIIVLLLVTATGGMLLASQGLPPISIIVSVLFGGALTAGGASALNHGADRDIDRLMPRTAGRPVANERLSVRDAFIFGIALNIIGFLLLWWQSNLLSGALAISGTFIYLVIYTKWLKRTTIHNIVIGGAAGAMPPLVGWAAVNGGLSLSAFYLFAIIFFWTPPHFWALALLLRRDYASAGIPMLPVVEGVKRTKLAILLYTILLFILTVLLFLSSNILGLYYLIAVMLLSGLFFLFALRLYLSSEQYSAGFLYRYSLLYLALVFGVIMVESVI